MCPTLSLPPTGKLTQRTSAAVHVCTITTGRLFITDRNTKRQFLVDTGSDLCVYPCRLIPRHMERVDYDLCAANGSTIHTYGWLPLSLNLGLCRDFTWRFVVANVTHPIIGMDFLSHFGLLVHCRNNCLLDGVTMSAPAQAASSQVPSVKTITGGTPVDSLLSEFPDVTRPAGAGARYATAPVTISGCYQAHQSPADHGDWHQTGSPSPKPSSTPCCGKVRLAALRVPGHLLYTSYPRTRTTVGVPAAATEC
jgi:hypothetical protein